MTTFWKISNWIILGIQATICGLGTFYKHIAFGWGLGDLLWYGLMYSLFAIHLGLTISSRKKGFERHLKLTIIFLLTTVYICLQATVWRDIEYPWNGELFYKN